MPSSKLQYIRKIEFQREKFPSLLEYPFNLPVMRELRELPLHSKVTYLIGENGMGKSTILEAIAIAAGFNPEGGTFNFNFSTYDSHSELDHYLRLIRGAHRPKDGFFLRAETFYNVASNIEEIGAVHSYGGVSLHEQSHGESFFAAITHRFIGQGIYILDEPEAALSPIRQLSVLAKIHELVDDDSQFIIATHSPIIMAYPDAKILELSEQGIHETSLEETQHYKIMKQFFTDKERLIHHLLRD